MDAVDGGVVGKFASGESSVEGWDLGADIGYLVEECAAIESYLLYTWLERRDILIGSVPKVSHGEVKVKRVVDWAEQLFAICRY